VEHDAEVRVATVDDAEVAARLLHDFNAEFATGSPTSTPTRGERASYFLRELSSS
jgi:hypothetical protein